MGLFVRRITYDRWRESIQSKDIPISSDAVSCLQTDGDTLSVWYAEDQSALSKAVLALLGTLSRVGHIYLSILDEDELRAAGFNFEQSPDHADTCVKFKELHYDIVNLTGESLLTLANIIRENLVKNSCLMIVSDEVVERLAEAVISGHVDCSGIKGGYLDSICEELGVIADISSVRCGSCTLSDPSKLKKIKLAGLHENLKAQSKKSDQWLTT